MTQYYLGIKKVLAWPQEKEGKAGYAVQYPDGYTSWSPADVFERAYLPMGESNDGSHITLEMVDGFVHKMRDEIVDGKLSIAIATLKNGFLWSESSGCVSPEHFDHEIGMEACAERIKGQIWKCLGFVLQWADAGLFRE